MPRQPQQQHAQPSEASEKSCTRLFVQNLPSYVDTSRLKEHFAAKGEVTDACVIRTKDGKKSRRFGFVGYKSAQQAQLARNFFDKSFLDTCKLSVQFALSKNSEDIQRPWSKYSAGSSRFDADKTESPAADKKTAADTAANTNASKVKQNNNDTPDDKPNPEFEEFMETMQARSKTRFWANDDVQAGDVKESDEAKLKQAMGDDSSDDDDSDEEKDDEEAQSVKKKQVQAMSDLDFLRSKVVKDLEGDYDSSNDEEEEGDEEEEEEDDDDAKGKTQRQTKEKKTTGDTADQTPEEPAKEEPEKPSARLFVRNLPFSAVEEDLTELFGAFGEILEVHIPLDDTKRRKGFGFVLFKSSVDAQEALKALNGVDFQGRVLHVLNAAMKKETLPTEEFNGTFKQKKELERQAKAQQNRLGWNASFIRGDATVGTLAERMGVKRSDILDKEYGNMAVGLAVGETMLVKENKEFFAEQGVDLDAMESTLMNQKKSGAAASAAKKIERSANIILIKNLPHTTDEEELAQLFVKHGDLGRFLLAPSKALALVEFLEPSEARKAFRALAYKKYQHVPLYLEWAPLKIFTKPASQTAMNKVPKGIKPANEVVSSELTEGSEDQVTELNTTICVKNLNFSTTESTLEKLFKQCGQLRKVTVAKRKDPKRKGQMLSMGFGFVEFVSAKDAEQAINSLQSTVVDGHALNLRISQKKLGQVPKRKAEDDASSRDKKSKSKIIVRNVAFEATSHDIRDLFAAFGQLKRVRLPRKFDGKHRGFAFVEFLTEQEAQTAFAALSSSHLYGRHLVLEWAEDADDLETLRLKASKDLSTINESERRKRLKASHSDDEDHEGEY